MLTQKLTWYDPRHGDNYAVTLDQQCNFESALRYVGQIGRDPIGYNSLDDIPEPARSKITEMIAQRKQAP